MGIRPNYGVTFAGATYVTPDADDSTAVVSDETPAPGTSITLTVTALDGATPAPFRGVAATVSSATGITVGSVEGLRTDADGVVEVPIAIALGAAETERTVTVSVGGVTLATTPTFTITA